MEGFAKGLSQLSPQVLQNFIQVLSQLKPETLETFKHVLQSFSSEKAAANLVQLMAQLPKGKMEALIQVLGKMKPEQLQSIGKLLQSLSSSQAQSFGLALSNLSAQQIQSLMTLLSSLSSKGMAVLSQILGKLSPEALQNFVQFLGNQNFSKSQMNQLLSVLANLSKQLGPKEFEASLKNIMKLLQNGADFDSVIKSLKLNGKDFSKKNQQLLEAAALLKSKEGKINMNDRAVEALAISEAAADEKDKKARKSFELIIKVLR